MRKPSMTGIGGVLGDLISEDPPKPKPADTAKARTPKKPPKTPPKRPHARIGRPPGKGNTSPSRKEKLTVRIDGDLVEKYRDWSWGARCNLGELVSQAMRNYLKTRRDS